MAKRKLAIVSDKPQTTRHTIRAVVNLVEAQIVFIDTPGFHKPKDGLGRRLNRKVTATMAEVDIVLFLLDGAAGIGRGDRYLANELKGLKTPVVMALNKIDTMTSEAREKELKSAQGLLADADVLEISGAQNQGVARLVEKLASALPPGPKYYPDDMSTDQPEQVLMAEFIREKLIELTREELPYAVAVEVYEVRRRPGRDLVDVYARIHVERESQKGIIIGHRGSVLEEVGRVARAEIELLLGSQIYLDIMVKVTKDWRRKERQVEEFGY